MGAFGGGGSIFDNFFGGQESSNRGSDLRFDLEIDFEEAIFGCTKDIALSVMDECGACKGSGAAPDSKRETCRRCGGSGMVVMGNNFFQVRQTCPTCGGAGQTISKPCRECRGEGQVKARRTLSLRIPPGVETGSRLRLAGKGEAGTRGGPAGDLYVVLHVRAHALFQRRGDDILCDMPVPFHLAALGGEIEVPTVQGFVTMKIPAGIENGTVLRLRGKGGPSIQGGSPGDQHVRVLIDVPEKLSGRQRDLIRDLGETMTESNYPRIREVRRRATELYERKRKLTGE
jgi:molecular chaperone DnaJ